MKMLRLVLVAVAATSAGMVSSALADHDHLYAGIAGHAEEIAYTSREFKDALRDEFRGSRVYGELIATNARARAKANYLQAVVRPGRSASNVDRFIAELDESICRLGTLIHEAKHRSARGFDPPLICTHETERQLVRMQEANRCIRRDWAILSHSAVRVYREDINPGYPEVWRYDRPLDYPDSIGRGRTTYGPLLYGNNGPGSWNHSSTDRGLSIGRDGLTLHSGPLSVHFNR